MSSMLKFILILINIIACSTVSHGLKIPRTTENRSLDVPRNNVTELRLIHSVNQIPVGRALRPAEKIKNDYVRWRGQPPTHIIEDAEAAATQTGSVQAADQPNDAGYLAPVTIGGQKFLVDIDTGSSDFWVFSNQLPKTDWGTHSLYTETGKQYTNPYETWDISYADGSGASGNVWLDNVALGGIRIPAVVEAATKISQNYVNQKKDGVIGFAFDSGSTCRPYGCETFMTLASPNLRLPLFTATLRKGKAGTYDFGFIDPKKYSGSIGYVTADNSSGYWGLQPTGYSIGSGKQQPLTFSTIADTGTVLLYVPNAIMNAYYPQVKGAYQNQTNQYVYFPCTSKLPNFSLYINGHKATVPGSYLNAEQVSSTTCLGGMQAEGHVGANILGDQFLKSQFVVFDLDGPRIGFAQQRGLPPN